MPDRTNTLRRVCIVQPSRGARSETFIHAHAERLPAEMTVVHNLKKPKIDGRPVLSAHPAARLRRALLRSLGRLPEANEVTTALLHVFQTSGADLVLAEYGKSGVAALEACRIAGLPLVVHFHGSDATQHEVLRQFKDA